MEKFSWVFTLLALLFFGCTEQPSGQQVETGQGTLSLSMLPITAKMLTKAIDDTVLVDIDLGIVKASKNFYFQIKNIKGAPIEDLKVTTSNPKIKMTPSKVPILYAEGESSISLLSTMTVLHGTSIENGEPIVPLLEYGLTTFTVDFDGISDDKPFHESFTVAVRAIYVDVQYDAKALEMKAYTLEATMEYGGDTCTVYNNGERLSIGDTAEYAYENPKPVRQDEDSVWINSYILWPGKWSSDCIIRQQLPVDLQ